MQGKERLLRVGLPTIFFIFILGIIILADSADYNFAFRLVGHIPYGDKIAHASLYGVMAFLLNYGLGFRCKNILGFSVQLGAIAVLLFAGLEELSQYYFPSRTLDFYDFLADIVGVVLASFIGLKDEK